MVKTIAIVMLAAVGAIEVGIAASEWYRMKGQMQENANIVRREFAHYVDGPSPLRISIRPLGLHRRNDCWAVRSYSSSRRPLFRRWRGMQRQEICGEAMIDWPITAWFIGVAVLILAGFRILVHRKSKGV